MRSRLLTTSVIIIANIVLLTFANSIHAVEEEAIGKLLFTIGKVYIKKDNQKRKKARRNTKLYEGDLIITGKKGQAQIKFIDNGKVAVRPNSQLLISEYAYKESEKKDSKSIMQLVKGGFRAVSGKVGKSNRGGYQIKTVNGTIGIRGTDYSVMMCDGNCSGKSKSIESGLYVGVVKGGITLRNDKGILNIDQNQYAFVSSINKLPKLLPKAPEFLMFSKAKASKRERRSLTKLLRDKFVKKNISSDRTDDKEDKQRARLSRDNRENSNSTRSSNTESTKQVTTTAENAAPDNSGQATQNKKRSTNGQNFSLARTIISRYSDAASGTPQSSIPGVPTALPDAIELGDTATSSNSTETVVGPTSPPLIDEGNIRTTLAEVLGLNRFFTSSLTHADHPYSLAVNTSSENKIDSFYTATESGSRLLEYTIVTQNTALLKDYGYDPDTGISWGRWSDNSAISTTHTLDEITSETLDLTSSSIHWVLGPENNLVLPSTGTKQYALIGNTNPTDNLGNIGYLGSATLSADFTAKTVDSVVNIGINQQNWQGSAQDMVLGGNGRFNGNNVSVTVDGVAANGGGSITGGFSGSGASGAALQYNLNNDTTSVNGTAVFQEVVK